MKKGLQALLLKCFEQLDKVIHTILQTALQKLK